MKERTVNRAKQMIHWGMGADGELTGSGVGVAVLDTGQRVILVSGCKNPDYAGLFRRFGPAKTCWENRLVGERWGRFSMKRIEAVQNSIRMTRSGGCVFPLATT